MSIFRFNPQKPGKPEAILVSSIDLSEPFVARIWGLLDILKLTDYKNQKEINDAILYVLNDCLLPAHISLENIRKHAVSPGLPELNKEKDYIDLHNYLWAAYKDRMQIVFKGTSFDVGFLFDKPDRFQPGMDKLKLAFPSLSDDFFNQITSDRNTWQEDIKTIRNDYIQHKKIDPEIASKYFTPQNAEVIFNNIWLAIENLILNFLVQEFPQTFGITDIPESQRDPSMPKRYVIDFGFVQ
jgi:hypothetical protein